MARRGTQGDAHLCRLMPYHRVLRVTLHGRAERRNRSRVLQLAQNKRNFVLEERAVVRKTFAKRSHSWLACLGHRITQCKHCTVALKERKATVKKPCAKLGEWRRPRGWCWINCDK